MTEGVFVLDTHALLWYLTGNGRLSARVRDILDRADDEDSTVIVPTIVLAEALHLIERAKFDLTVEALTDAVATPSGSRLRRSTRGCSRRCCHSRSSNCTTVLSLPPAGSSIVRCYPVIEISRRRFQPSGRRATAAIDEQTRIKRVPKSRRRRQS